MEIINDPGIMQRRANELRGSGKRIGFIPTMGALHDGHLSLVDEAKRRTDVIVLSIYVNPTQFGPREDLATYPSDFEGDVQKARSRGVDIIFCPKDNAMYPDGFKTFVETQDITAKLCGASRPTHFRGVTTIVLKLFNIVKPHCVIFGQKDYQQLKVIETMTRDLNLEIEIIGAPIVREKDGIAMSSRNRYLNPEERMAARSVSESLCLTQKMVDEGETDLIKLGGLVKSHIESNGIGRVDYVRFCNPETLEDMTEFTTPSLLAVAAHFGKTRLIDNHVLRTQSRKTA